MEGGRLESNSAGNSQEIFRWIFSTLYTATYISTLVSYSVYYQVLNPKIIYLTNFNTNVVILNKSNCCNSVKCTILCHSVLFTDTPLFKCLKNNTFEMFLYCVVEVSMKGTL